MTSKATDEIKNAAQLLQFGKERTDAMLNVNKELLDAYQEASKAWIGRVQSEVQFWSELAGKLAASRSVPEGLGAYGEGISHRLQMAAEDGRRLFEDGQKMVAFIAVHFLTDRQNHETWKRPSAVQPKSREGNMQRRDEDHYRDPAQPKLQDSGSA